MGGLACGAPLCDSCVHSGEDATHITQAAYAAQEAAAETKRQKKMASRTSPVPMMHPELGVPATLFELLKGDWGATFELGTVYDLELSHGLMGYFPAIISSEKKRIVYAADLKLLERVWVMLDPREARLNGSTAFVRKSGGIAYFSPDDPSRREDMEPVKLLTDSEMDALLGGGGVPFKWAPGLFGGRNLESGEFLRSLEEQARRFEPRFEPSRATV